MGHLFIIVLLVGYGIGAWKFWSGFKRTNFTKGRLYLTALWPIFFLSNKPYRQNFNKALKG